MLNVQTRRQSRTRCVIEPDARIEQGQLFVPLSGHCLLSNGSPNGECEVLIMSRCSSGNKSLRVAQVAGCGHTRKPTGCSDPLMVNVVVLECSLAKVAGYCLP